MHCASCAAIITKKLSQTPGIEKVEVNLATEQAKVSFREHDLSDSEINDIVGKFGYKLTSKEDGDAGTGGIPAEIKGRDPDTKAFSEKQEQVKQLKRLVSFSLPAAMAVFFHDVGYRFYGIAQHAAHAYLHGGLQRPYHDSCRNFHRQDRQTLS